MVSEINRKKRLVKKNNNEWVNFIWTNIKEHETSKWLEKKHKSNVKWRQSHRNSMKLNVRGEGGRTREFEEIEVEALRWLVLLWMLMCSSFSVSDLSFGFGPFLLCCYLFVSSPFLLLCNCMLPRWSLQEGSCLQVAKCSRWWLLVRCC